MKKPDKEKQRRLHKKRERRRQKRNRVLKERIRKTGSKRKPTNEAQNIVRSKIEKREKETLRFVAQSILGVEVDRLPRKQWKRGKRRTIRFPEVFSFLENPNRALSTLGDLMHACVDDNVVIVKLDQTACRVIDYGAESVACAIALAAKKGTGLQFEGRYPEHIGARNIAMATGLPKAFGAGDELPGFVSFPLRQGRLGQERADTSTKRDRCIDNFTDYIDRCLRRYEVALTLDGKAFLAGLVSEVIGNAEDHSGRDEWWIGGYLRETLHADADCHLTIFNFGRDIYHSLQRLSEGAKLREHINDLTRKHTGFKVFGSRYSEAELWTLYAMQAGVSRYNSDDSVIGHRGQGTADIIEFFQHLGQASEEGVEPKMCVVSGQALVLFDGRYRMKEEVVFGEKRRIIAFNEDNDLWKAPDSRNVKRLKRYFPGTLISMRFFLNREHLKRIGGEADGSNQD